MDQPAPENTPITKPFRLLQYYCVAGVLALVVLAFVVWYTEMAVEFTYAAVAAVVVLFFLISPIVYRANGLINTYHLNQQVYQLELEYTAFHDSLTGLPNRTHFNERFPRAVARARRNNRLLAIMFLDLDRLMNINDSLGHANGDLLLKLVSQRFLDSIREEDTVARVGGDEFVILLENVEQIESISIVANRVIESLSEPVDLNGHEVIVTVSAGITIYPSDDTEIENLLRNADVAMSRAKKRGRNQYMYYTADMNKRGAERLAMERNLRKALELHQYRLHYQPKVESTTGKMVGMEALLRWERPEKGLISPAEFIPVLEDCGLIIPVGEWVLRKACEENKAWQDAGFAPLRVAVNVSAHQFKQSDFVDVVRRILADTGLEPKYLELELTESVVMEDAQTSMATLDELKQMGIHIAMDDFGTGYSSLSYLKRIPIDTLKIDQSFIRNLNGRSDNAAIVTAIMALAHSLRLNVVAEGVEEAKELMFLSALGCHVIQGFYFSKPLPADEFTSLQEDSTHFLSLLRSLRTA